MREAVGAPALATLWQTTRSYLASEAHARVLSAQGLLGPSTRGGGAGSCLGLRSAYP